MTATLLGACAAFVAAALLYSAYFLLPSRRVARAGAWALGIGTAMLGVVLALRVFSYGGAPLKSFSDGLALFAWVLAAVFLFVALRWRVPALGGFVTPVVALAALSSTLLREPDSVPEALRLAGLPIHVAAAFLGLSALSIATGSAVAYLALERQMKRKEFGVAFERLPSLETLDRLSSKLMTWGFVFLSLTLVTGAFFAKRAWGEWLPWDPKLVASLIAWGIFAILFHARAFAGWRGRRAAALTIAGFVVLFGSFLAFNLFPVGVHGGDWR